MRKSILVVVAAIGLCPPICRDRMPLAAHANPQSNALAAIGVSGTLTIAPNDHRVQERGTVRASDRPSLYSVALKITIWSFTGLSTIVLSATYVLDRLSHIRRRRVKCRITSANSKKSAPS